MPNRNYVKGRRKEYKVVNKLKSLGFPIAFRSAGSHNPIDVVGIDILHKEIHLYQSKPKNFSKSLQLHLLEQWAGLNNKFDVTFKIV